MPTTRARAQMRATCIAGGILIGGAVMWPFARVPAIVAFWAAFALCVALLIDDARHARSYDRPEGELGMDEPAPAPRTQTHVRVMNDRDGEAA